MHPLLSQHLPRLQELCREHGARELHAFGSSASDDGTFDPGRSDFDLLVEFVDEDLGPWMKRFFDFQRACEALLGRRVDLVLASALRGPQSHASPFIRASVEARKVPMYAAA